MQRVALRSSKTVALSCTAQNLTWPQEFQSRVRPALTCCTPPGQLTSWSPHSVCVSSSFGEAFEVLRRRLHHHLLVIWSLVVRVHSVCLQRFQAHLQCQEVHHATSRMRRSWRELFSVLCPLVFSSNESDLHPPFTVLHLPTFLPSSRQGFEFRRVLTLHVFHHSNAPTSCPALSQSPAGLKEWSAVCVLWTWCAEECDTPRSVMLETRTRPNIHAQKLSLTSSKDLPPFNAFRNSMTLDSGTSCEQFFS